jgi:riboflavin kinase/FMN adenylyltransferase
MQHTYDLQTIHLQNSWLTIGSFDGVHLGHQQIIHQITAGAHHAGVPAVVLTFYPHPSVVLRGPRSSFYLTLPEEKAAILSSLGVDLVVTHPFNRQVAATPPREFVQSLHQHLHFQQLWVGYDFALGRDRAGDIPYLQTLGQEFGFQVKVVSPVQAEGETVSSSRIRRHLEAGELAKANELLGRPFAITGKVVPGDGRGKTIGVPTANIETIAERAIPQAGVYACRVTWRGESYPAVTNVGVRPTFETELVPARVEAHIMDFSQDLYGEELKLEFIARLRPERRFESIDALVAQIHQDIEDGRRILADSN